MNAVSRVEVGTTDRDLAREPKSAHPATLPHFDTS